MGQNKFFLKQSGNYKLDAAIIPLFQINSDFTNKLAQKGQKVSKTNVYPKNKACVQRKHFTPAQ